MFIDKVRHLEQQNKSLEMELVTLRQKQSEPSRIASLYQQEMRDLRSQVEELNRDKNRVLIERNNLEDELQVGRFCPLNTSSNKISSDSHLTCCLLSVTSHCRR